MVKQRKNQDLYCVEYLSFLVAELLVVLKNENMIENSKQFQIILKSGSSISASGALLRNTKRDTKKMRLIRQRYVEFRQQYIGK